MLDLRKIGGALQTKCVFKNERWPGEGDMLQTGDARITARIRFVAVQLVLAASLHSLYLTIKNA